MIILSTEDRTNENLAAQVEVIDKSNIFVMQMVLLVKNHLPDLSRRLNLMTLVSCKNNGWTSPSYDKSNCTGISRTVEIERGIISVLERQFLVREISSAFHHVNMNRVGTKCRL
jgi:hypothetical protein